jgi:hypothetical protein
MRMPHPSWTLTTTSWLMASSLQSPTVTTGKWTRPIPLLTPSSLPTAPPHKKGKLAAPPPCSTPSGWTTSHEEDRPSVFEVLNIFRQHWFLHREHLIANVLSTQTDDAGRFTWVDFQAPFHTHLVQCMQCLLPPLCPVVKGKKVMFVFLLEVLDRGCREAFFDQATEKKKTRKCCKRTWGTASSPPPPLLPTPILCKWITLPRTPLLRLVAPPPPQPLPPPPPALHRAPCPPDW